MVLFFANAAGMGAAFTLLGTTLSTSTFAKVTAGGAAAAGVYLLLLRWLNIQYDKVEFGKARWNNLGRWAGSTLFYGMIAAAVMMLVNYISHSGGENSIAFYFVLVLLLFAMSMYRSLYKYNCGMDIRMKLLSERFVRYKNRRYSLVVTDAKAGGDGTLEGSGVIHGCMHQLDKVFIYGPKGLYTARVIFISENGTKTTTANDTFIHFRLKSTMSVPWEDMMVISDAAAAASLPMQEIKAENPYLRGLINDTDTCLTKKAFIDRVFLSFAYSHLLMCGIAPDKEAGDLMDPVFTNMSISFGGLSSPQHEGSFLAAFTDWDALARADSLVHMDKAQVMQVRPDQLISMVRNTADGIILNPYGTRPFLITKDSLDLIEVSDVYKKLFNRRGNDKHEE